MKLKTKKSLDKRVCIKKNSIIRKKAFKSHLMKTKNSKRIRRLSLKAIVNKADFTKAMRLLPYS